VSTSKSLLYTVVIQPESDLIFYEKWQLTINHNTVK